MTMVVQELGYYVKPFKGYQGVTKGYPLSTILFNLVVDVVVRHCIKIMADEARVFVVLERAVHIMAYFYMDDSLISSTWP